MSPMIALNACMYRMLGNGVRLCTLLALSWVRVNAHGGQDVASLSNHTSCVLGIICLAKHQLLDGDDKFSVFWVDF